MNNIGLIGIITLVSFVLTYFVKKYALRNAIIDKPNERSSHTIPTPRGGGLAIAISWFLGLISLYFSNEIENPLFFALLSGFILVIIGLIDDIFDISPPIRLAAQFLSTGLAIYFLGGISTINFGFATFNSFWIFTPLAFIGIIWFINLFNFLDGIDGYASMEAIFVSLCFFFAFNDSIFLIFAAATLGFLFWNWQPAKIFMGDVGSTLIGFNIAVLLIYYQNTTQISIFTLLIPSVLFWFDASWTLLRRYRNKEKLTEAHKKHAYQRIVQAGFSHRKTVIYALLINLLLAIVFYFSICFSNYVLLFLFLSILIAYAMIRIIDKKKPFKLD